MVSKLHGSEVHFFELRAQEKEQQRQELHRNAAELGAQRLAKAKASSRRKVILKAFG